VRKWTQELNREFSKEEVQMASKYMKKCSTSLAIKEMQIQTTLRFHLIPLRMAIYGSSHDVSLMMDGLKKWYLYTMEFYSATKRMKFCCLQVNEWNWRTSS
jgi:hypothetical protein